MESNYIINEVVKSDDSTSMYVNLTTNEDKTYDVLLSIEESGSVSVTTDWPYLRKPDNEDDVESFKIILKDFIRNAIIWCEAFKDFALNNANINKKGNIGNGEKEVQERN